MATLFDLSSPERGWEPFLDWLRSHDLNPNDVRSVAVNEVSIVAELIVRGDDGAPIVDGGELRTRTQTVALHTDPPRRIVTQAPR